MDFIYYIVVVIIEQIVNIGLVLPWESIHYNIPIIIVMLIVGIVIMLKIFNKQFPELNILKAKEKARES